MLHLLKQLTGQLIDPDQVVRSRYTSFKGLLNSDRECHHLLAEIEKVHYSGKAVDIARLRILFNDFSASVEAMIDSLRDLAPGRYKNLADYYRKIDFYARFALAEPELRLDPPYVLPLDNVYENDSAVGGKAFHLSHLKQGLGLPVPAGFIFSTAAWNAIVEYNNLRDRIDRELAEIDFDSLPSLQTRSAALTALVEGATLPEPLVAGMEEAVAALQVDADARFAVRSSAVAEDSDVSFAGQYLSLLDVDAQSIGSAYLSVAASKYSPEAMLYRILNGIDDRAAPMAVLVLEMVRAATSGVAVTCREPDTGSLQVQVHAVEGLGDRLMSGEIVPDVTTLSVSGGDRSVGLESGHECGAESARLNPHELTRLAEYAEIIDTYYGLPQEIEWSLDTSGRLHLLQSRRITHGVNPKADSQGPPPDLPLLFEGGETAASGVACGRVFRLKHVTPLPEIPDGAVVVCEITPPSLVALLPRAAAVIAAGGSSADHFSSVAREFGVPVLLQTGAGIECLHPGMQIYLDADRRQVYEGSTDVLEKEGLRLQLAPESEVGRILKMVVDFCSPLSLLDPADDSFRPENCRSLHDIVRFVHEKGVQAMFLNNADSFFRKPTTIKLQSGIPLQVFLIDVGGGVAGGRRSHAAAVIEEIESIPFRALWQGLSHPGVNWRGREHFDWASYDAVALAGGIAGKDDAALSSYCLMSRDYCNINMRFGYHFTLVDCICGETPEENYILMRFAGGGGTGDGKDLRLQFIAEVLQRLGFVCEQNGDILDGRLMRYNRDETAERMTQVGHLLGSVRLLDMVLRDESEVAELVGKFFAGIYDFSNE